MLLIKLRLQLCVLAFVVLWPSGHMNVICFGVRTLGIGLCLLPLMVPLARVIFRVVILC